jgi:hypothetical protein
MIGPQNSQEKNKLLLYLDKINCFRIIILSFKYEYLSESDFTVYLKPVYAMKQATGRHF